MAGRRGTYIAMGLTSKVPGFYAGAPIRDAGGTIVSAAVVKFNLDKSFMAPISGNYGFLVDAKGIIIGSTRPGYVMKALRPLPVEVRHRLVETQQFPSLSDASVLPAGYLPGSPITFQGQRLQGFEQTTSVMGLSFVLLGPMTSLALARFVAILITLLAAVLVVTFFVLQQKSSESLARIASSETLHRTWVQGSPNWIGLFDHDGRCLSINENGLAAMGRAGAEVQGRRFSEIWSEGRDPLLEDMVRRVFTGERVSFEYKQTLPDGPSRTWQIVLNPG
jgi:PAS domain S-box-containing protein